MRKGKTRSAVLGLFLLATWASQAEALTLGLSKVADLDTAIPSGGGNFTGFSSFPALSEGQVVFSGVGAGEAGVYLFDGATLSRVADLDTSIPMGSGTFTDFPGSPLISGGRVAFQGAGSGGQLGNYLFDGVTLSRVADLSTSIPSGSGAFTGLTSPVISGGNVAFQGTGTGGQLGIYLFNGLTLGRVADLATAVPGGTGNFTAVGPPVISGGRVAFLGLDGSGLPGIYLFNGGGLSRVADTTTSIPMGAGTFTSFSSPPALSGSHVAFLGLGSGGQAGIYLFDGVTLGRVADLGTAIPNGTGSFTVLNPPVISGGQVAFHGAGGLGQAGIYRFSGGMLGRIADTGTAIPGGTGNFTSFFSPPALSGSRVAFLGFGSAGQAGDYFFDGATLSRVADLMTTIPEGTGAFTGLSSPTLDGDNIALQGSGASGQEGIYFAGPSAGLMALTALGPARLRVGLRNSDDFGTPFDVKVEVRKNGSLVASGLLRCITGLVRNPAGAQEAQVPFDPFTAVPVGTGDVLSLKVLARIGTKPGDARCAKGHSNATGLRLYYDAVSRASRFGATIGGSAADWYLHSDGGVCTSAESAGVSNRFLDMTAPTAMQARCEDSGAVKFGGGNKWSEIGTWSAAPLP